MKYPLQPIVSFLLVVLLVATHAALSPELYWKSMLPTTPMPKSITDLLHPAVNARSGHSITIRGEIEIGDGGHHCQLEFCYADSETKVQGNPNTALFFLEKDLKVGHRMNLVFKKTSNQASSLPREVVKSIPFSSSKMAEILNEFAVKPGSINAELMKNTIKFCEESGIKGEEKYCATSLESMVDFITSKLGRHVEALSTEVVKETKKQEYKIMHGVKKVGGTKVLVCHKLNYVYAVFYCHKIKNTVTYTVSLKGADGSRVKDVSVCHRDTSQWNPKHLALQMLKVKPGSVPICHFLFKDTFARV
ncbi:BURP domain-containing protein 3-like [Prosopis cineraria]|uniref:BURP domain-containing protein 3-like n=1 Tax=Prosopis cineraria TaxID=364024 RepID=UPI00240F7D3D|nr:BURP domain-containing protein 3-like [Prosopis cineraria]